MDSRCQLLLVFLRGGVAGEQGAELTAQLSPCTSLPTPCPPRSRLLTWGSTRTCVLPAASTGVLPVILCWQTHELPLYPCLYPSSWAVSTSLWLSLPLAYVLLRTVARSNTHQKRPGASWALRGELSSASLSSGGAQLWASLQKHSFRKQQFAGMRGQHTPTQKHLTKCLPGVVLRD